MKSLIKRGMPYIACIKYLKLDHTHVTSGDM